MGTSRKLIGWATVVGLLFTGSVLISTPASADSRYKRSRYASVLKKGVLKVQGTGYGSWGHRWVQVATGVKSYSEAATSRGPVLVYQRGRQWHAIQLHFNTGHRLNPRHFQKPVKIYRANRYGVILQTRGKCYDYSYRQLRALRRCR